MASDLLSIARSGVKAARIQLDLTAQNIANASSQGYVRRSATTEEVMTPGYLTHNRDVSLSGVRIAGITRNADAFRQGEVRRTGADTARADAEVSGLEDIQAALSDSGVYDAITGFESTLQQLSQDPTNTPLRAAVIASAQTMTNSFNIAAAQLDAVAAGQQSGAADGVMQVNTLSAELAKVNGRLSRLADAQTDRAGLLDQRDLLLQKLSGYADIATSFATDGSVSVTLGGTSGAPLVTGLVAQTLTATTAADGTITYAVGGGPWRWPPGLCPGSSRCWRASPRCTATSTGWPTAWCVRSTPHRPRAPRSMDRRAGPCCRARPPARWAWPPPAAPRSPPQARVLRPTVATFPTSSPCAAP